MSGVPDIEASERDLSSARTGGIVLAGGGSRRMGVDKCALELGGRTLLQRAVAALEAVADEIVVVGAADRTLPAIASERPLRRAKDAIADGGPLVGVLAGIEASDAEVTVVVACDAPFLQPALLRLLAERAREGARCVVPVHEEQPQLLCSAWRREALSLIRERVAGGERSVGAMLDALGAERLPPEAWRASDPDGRSFVNVNTPGQLAEARELLRGD